MTAVKVLHLVHKSSELEWSDFVERWIASHSALARTLPGLQGLAFNVASIEQRGARPFDGYAVWRFNTPEESNRAWESEAGRAIADDEDLFSVRPSVLTVAESVVVASQSSPTKIIYLVEKLPQLSWRDFVTHWTTVHAELAKEMPGLVGYSINLADSESNDPRPFDGYAMLRFQSRADAKAAWETVAGKATAADGANFMKRPDGLMVDERIVIGWVDGDPR